jgi:hypothetical protein
MKNDETGITMHQELVKQSSKEHLRYEEYVYDIARVLAVPVRHKGLEDVELGFEFGLGSFSAFDVADERAVCLKVGRKSGNLSNCRSFHCVWRAMAPIPPRIYMP